MARDRTPEFRAALSSIRNRTRASIAPVNGSIPIGQRDDSKQNLLINGNGRGTRGAGKEGQKSEFARMAGQISKDLTLTMGKLQKLAQLAKRKTLFDDRPVEISELTYIIRQDISSLNSQIAQLQGFVIQQKKETQSSSSAQGKQKGVVEEHNNNVVMMLQSRLANVGVGFKDVLELRTQNMKASKDRTEQFMHTASSAATAPPSQNSVLFNSNSPSGGALSANSALLQPTDRKGKGRAYPSSSPLSGSTNPSSDFLALDMSEKGGPGSGLGSGGQMQQELVLDRQDEYIQSRSSAIEGIESTIAELGQIFQQLAGMVQQQGEMVQRIDADVTDISANVTGAQRELLKYYASITSNRWLMLKIFGVLIIFFLVFILVS
ncbi:hypothetical protein FFLO_05560 [Filobasidium floriforme]|uniref:t-SNARE coiled-coil homology domain-containing protein n=1 Tax=Filobasidium floriforme TaxID=5210 RepID=A0A8K0JI04_9TREE|nr:hypothetical protein FFLO_05560 [Filobasidium floriforme]